MKIEIDLNYFDEHADDENEDINLHSNEEEVNHEEYENIREELEYSFQVENCQTQTHRMVEGFDIKALVEMTEANANLSIGLNSYESNLSLIKNDNSSAAVTKSAFSRALIEYFQVSNTTISNQSLLLNLLHNSFGSVANLPVHLKSDINEDNEQQSTGFG